MLEIRKGAISFDEHEVMELQRIIMDNDEKEALLFLKKCVFDRVLHGQQGQLKSHLDGTNPVDGFSQKNK